MTAFRALLRSAMWTCVQACVCIRTVCRSSQVYIFMCIPSLVDASTHPWQPENTLIFPTLIVKEEAVRTEKVCVFVAVCVCVCVSGGGGEWKIYSTSRIKKTQGGKKKFGFHEALEGWLICRLRVREGWRERTRETERRERLWSGPSVLPCGNRIVRSPTCWLKWKFSTTADSHAHSHPSRSPPHTHTHTQTQSHSYSVFNMLVCVWRRGCDPMSHPPRNGREKRRGNDGDKT